MQDPPCQPRTAAHLSMSIRSPTSLRSIIYGCVSDTVSTRVTMKHVLMGYIDECDDIHEQPETHARQVRLVSGCLGH